MLKRIKASIRFRSQKWRHKIKELMCLFKLSRKRRQILNFPYKVSVIAAVYNTEKYLRQCLDSILNQTYKNIEVVCVNDCSTDGSLNILKEYAQKDRRVVIVDKPVNEGLPQARKSGLAKANGQWILMIDSDDWIEENMIESLLGIAISGGFDMTCCDVLFGMPEGHEIWMRVNDVPQDKLQQIKKMIFDLDGHGKRNVWNKLVKKEVYEKIEFPTESTCEDNYITCQNLYFSNKVGYVPLALIHYRFNEKSLTNDPQKALLRYLELKSVFDRVIGFCKENFGNDLSVFEPEFSKMMAWIENHNPEKLGQGRN